MVELNLRAYVDYISDRLTRGAYDEVVAQCRHVLETYPKFVESYKLLGQALVKKGRYKEAVDVFQRVLSCDPNDYEGHIGISQAFQQQGQTDAAIWHLKRAYEQVPGNAVVEEEIRKLVQLKTGQAPRQIPRTSGALARLYAKGGLYQQAIPELRKALRRDPSRLDLKLLLALVLWDAREPIEAGQVAADVLRQLPYSIDGNRILAQLWLRAEQPKEAQPFIARLKELNPYIGYEVEHGRQAPVERFRLVRLDRDTVSAQKSEERTGGNTDWLDALDSVEKKEGVTGPLDSGKVSDSLLDDEDTPDWLKEAQPFDEDEPQGTGRLSEPRSIEEILADENTTDSPTAGPELTGDEPDWLRDALMEETPPGLESVARPTPEGDVPEDAPDWLRDVMGEDEPQVEEPAPSPAEAVKQQPVPPPIQEPEVGPEGYDTQQILADMEFEDGEGNRVEVEQDTPDWLTNLDQGVEEPPPRDDLDEDIMPDWLRESTNEEPQTEEMADLPDWLQDEDATPKEPLPAAGSPPAEADEADEDDLPSWLQDEMQAAPAQEAKPVQDADLDWFDEEIPTEVTAQPAAAEEDADLPDWLQDEMDSTPTSDAVEADEAPRLTDTGWLSGVLDEDIDPEASPPPDGDSTEEFGVPDWLSGATEQTPDAPQEPPAEEPQPRLTDTGWLSNILDDDADPDLPESPAAMASSPVDAEDVGVPDWLAGLVDDEPIIDTEHEEDEDWLSTLTSEEPQKAPPSTSQEEDDDIPDWLFEATDDAPVAPSPEPTQAAADTDEDEDIPAWLRESADTPAAPPTATEEEVQEGDSVPEWLKDSVAVEQPGAVHSTSQDEDEGIPDWLQESTPQRLDSPVPAASASEEQDTATVSGSPKSQSDDQPVEQLDSTTEEVTQMVPPDDDMFDDDDMPDWLTEGNLDDSDAAMAWLNEIAAKYDPDFQADDEGQKEAEAVTETADDDLPDWLSDEEPEPETPPEPVQEAVASAPADDDLPDWLKGDDDDMPDWLSGDEPEDTPEPAQEVTASAPAADDGMPDWLSDESLAAETADEGDDLDALLGDALAEDDDDLPDWLKDDAPAEAEPAKAEEPAPVEPETPSPEPAMAEVFESDDDTPDWLSSGNLDDEDAAMAWLNEIAAKYDPDFDADAEPAAQAEEAPAEPAAAEEAPAEPEPTPEPVATEADEGDMPDWLREPAEVPGDGDMPDWLKDMPEEETTPEPTVAQEAPEPVTAEADDALSWLDEQVEDQGVSKDEVVSDALEADKPPTPEMPFIPDPEAKAVEADEDELPAWLRDVEPDTLAEGEEDELVLALEGEEDDEDELESALDDIFGDDSDTTDDELAAIFEETPTEEPAPEAPAAEDEERDRTGMTDWLTPREEEEEAAEEPVAEAPEDESLPTWIGGSAAVEEKEEDDLAAFLRATEPAKTAPLTPPTEAPQAPAASQQPPQTSGLEPPTEKEAPAEQVPAEPVAEKEVGEAPRVTSMLPELRRRPLPEGQSAELVKEARAQIEDAAFDDALDTYERLIVNQQSLDVVVGDLQNLLNARPTPRTRRVLGDALMMSGNLDQALDMYRTALDEL